MQYRLALVFSAVLTVVACDSAFAAGAVSMTSDGLGGVNLLGDTDANKLIHLLLVRTSDLSTPPQRAAILSM